MIEGENLLAVPVQPMGMARSVYGAKVYRRDERRKIRHLHQVMRVHTSGSFVEG